MSAAKKESFLSRLTVDELKGILRANGFAVSGLKADLIARVLDKTSRPDHILQNVNEETLKDYCKGAGLGGYTVWGMCESIKAFWEGTNSSEVRRMEKRLENMQEQVDTMKQKQQLQQVPATPGIAGASASGYFRQQPAPVSAVALPAPQQFPALPSSPFLPALPTVQITQPCHNPATGIVDHAQLGRAVPEIFFNALYGKSPDPRGDLMSKFFDSVQMQLSFQKRNTKFQDNGKAPVVDRLLQLRDTLTMTYNAPAVVVTPDHFGCIRLDIPGLYHVQGEPAGQYALSINISRDAQTQNTWLILAVMGEFR